MGNEKTIMDCIEEKEPILHGHVQKMGPVSYTHLDVYKRQLYSYIVKTHSRAV